MNRKTALQTLIGAAAASPLLAQTPNAPYKNFKEEFAPAWKRSRDYTLLVFNQMPEADLDFHYTPEAMTFRSQFVHCITFTAAQFSDRFSTPNPFDSSLNFNKLTKAQVAAEITRFYDWVTEIVAKLKPAKLNEIRGFAGDKMPNWRFFYAMENHLIHHRGQAICYLRIKGIQPEGYVGW